MRIDHKKFFDGYKAKFDDTLEQSQVDGLDALLTFFENEARWKDIRHIAYALATVFHECAGSWQPVEEGYYLGSKAAVKRFQQTLRYQPYFGRGYVQLTWKKNYIRAGEFLGIDLETKPELALDKNIAFSIMTWGMFGGAFTGKRLSDFINSRKTDYKGARAIINGKDKAALIASYAETFEMILENSTDKSTLIPAEKPASIPSAQSETSDNFAANAVNALTDSVSEKMSETVEGATDKANVIQNNIESKAEEKVIEIAQKALPIELPAPAALNFVGKLWKTILGIFGGTIVLPAFLENGLDWNAALQMILKLVGANFKYIFFGAIVGLSVWYVTKKINNYKLTQLVATINADVSKKDVVIVDKNPVKTNFLGW